MPSKRILDRIQAEFNDAPVKNGSRVFTTQEYARSIGVARRTAWDRVSKLLERGKLRKVRTRRGKKIVPAWELLSR